MKVSAMGRAQNATADEAIIIDHTCTDITAVPQEWIEEAKRALHIGYGHTSHGSQLTSGMTGLVSFANSGGLGLALPQDIFGWNVVGQAGRWICGKATATVPAIWITVPEGRALL